MMGIDTRTLKEKIMTWIAWRLPRKIVYYCAVRLGAEATKTLPKVSAPDLTLFDALENWKK